MELMTLEEALRRRRFTRRVWRYGTLALALAAASNIEEATGDGDGTVIFFPLIMGSVFANWSFYARTRPIRWVGWLGMAPAGAITVRILALASGWSDTAAWCVASGVGLALLIGRWLMDRKFQDPVTWYHLGDRAYPF